MRLGPILQAIVAAPALAPAADWAESALGLVVTRRGRFPRETALTLGSTALVEAPCVSVGLPAAPALLLIVEEPAASSSVLATGWRGLSLRRPGASAERVGLGLHWTLLDGEPALVAATLSCAAPAVSRGYYRGLGAQAPTAVASTRLPLREAELVLEPVTASADSEEIPRPLRVLVVDRGSPAALLPAPDAHGVGPDGEWLLLRAAPIRPFCD